MLRLAVPLAILTACSSSAPEPPTGVGVRTPVHILVGGFVRFEEQRIPTEAFLLEIRRRVRAAEGDPEQMPWVVVHTDDDVELPSARLEMITRELRKAGVRHLQLGRG